MNKKNSGDKSHYNPMRQKKTHLNIGGQLSKCGRTLSGIWDKFTESDSMVSCQVCLRRISLDQIHGRPKGGEETND